MTREKIRFSLPSVDDLFTTQEMRDEAKLKKIEEIPISEIDEFPDHPFKVREDDDMRLLIDSIREQGIITPTVVRQKSDGRYEMLSGHRRMRACELLGYEVIRAEVVDLDRDAARILMVDSNLQRTEILPSEKAFSYKMKLNAMKRQGRRTDLTSAPSVHKLRGNVSRDVLAGELGISREQVRRYIRLTFLIPELLQMVDDKRIGLRPAVEISYLPREHQENLTAAINYEDCTPSHAQARKIRALYDDEKLTEQLVYEVMAEEKAKPKAKDNALTIKNRKVFAKGFEK